MIAKSPLVELSNGVKMPVLGLGVYQTPPDKTAAAVATAIEYGYRLIDTAAAYGNEKEVGDGLRDSGIDRSEVFVITKLPITDYGYERALAAFDASLVRLGIDYVDLYMLHWPVPSDFEQTLAAYNAAERILAEGRARAIGVCSFSPQYLADLLARVEIVPAVNQVELHPLFNQRALRNVDARFGIVTQSWSPLGGVFKNHPRDPEHVTDLLADSTIASIAAKYGKTPAQVILRWHIQHGLSVIPKSVHPARIAENIDVFDFELTLADVSSIDGMDTGIRGGPDPDLFDLNFLAQLAGTS